MVYHDELVAVKERLGGLTFLDYTSLDLVSAYKMLGVNVKQQVHKIFRARLERLELTRISELFKQVHACKLSLGKKAVDSRINPLLNKAVKDYLDCLAVWAEGADLAGFNHPSLSGFQPLTPLDLALFLQHNISGCQTGMYRQADGAVILWHTEEAIELEIGSFFDQLRVAAFKVNDDNVPIIINGFIYPDLLPGPAFGWRSDGFAQAVDTLHTKTATNIQNGILANSASWITLRLGSTVEPGEVLDFLAPYYDGYALNTVYAHENKVYGKKFEYAADRIFPYELNQQANSNLFQANIFCQQADPWVQENERLRPEMRRKYEWRIENTSKVLQSKDNAHVEEDDIHFFFNLLTSITQDGWAYANANVKAYMIYRLDRDGAVVWTGYGPALPTDQVYLFNYPLK